MRWYSTKTRAKGDGVRHARKTQEQHLQATTETKDEVKSGLLLDVIVRKSTSILELLAGENQSLLVWGNPFLVLDLRLYVINGIRRLDFESDRLAGETVVHNENHE